MKNTAIALAKARGVVLDKDANLSVEKGVSIHLSKDCSKQQCSRMHRLCISPMELESLKVEL